MYPLGTWFVSGICVWLPCIKETMMIIIIIIIITETYLGVKLTVTKFAHSQSLPL